MEKVRHDVTAAGSGDLPESPAIKTLLNENA